MSTRRLARVRKTGSMVLIVVTAAVITAGLSLRVMLADTSGVAAVEVPAQIVPPQAVPVSVPAAEAPAQAVPPQDVPAVGSPAEAPPSAASTDRAAMSDLVTINIDDGMIVQVLNAFSRQTGRSIVVGPEVTGKVTARLSNVQWRDALDAILRPYGYGYYMAGDTIIVIGVDKLPKAAPVAVGAASAPSRVVKVFTLKYLDAADVESLIKGQLSAAGTLGRLVVQSQSWEEKEGAADTKTTTSESLGRLRRFTEKPDQVKGKTVVVVDTAEVIAQIEQILHQVDVAPVQIQIDARFVEVSTNVLRDIGFEWGTGPNGTEPGVKTVNTTQGGKLYGVGAQQVNNSPKPYAFDARSSGVRNSDPYNAGMMLAFQKLTDFQLSILLHLLEEDASYNVLSSPRLLTLNNQDAVIIVGTKLPIISQSTQASSSGSSVPTVSTTLERYEDVGIKLKVLPQVCDDGFINLIVHPSVRELVSFQSGKLLVGAESVSGTDYPVIDTREAETQVMVKSGQTVVIGGMIRENKKSTQLKVPFLGSIPLLGMLFRRDTVSTSKVELLIFLTARIRNAAEDDVPAVPTTKAAPLLEPTAAKATARQGGAQWDKGAR